MAPISDKVLIIEKHNVREIVKKEKTYWLRNLAVIALVYVVSCTNQTKPDINNGFRQPKLITLETINIMKRSSC